MSEVTNAVRSPLTLLERWRDRVDRAPLREMLIIGYTVDLGFLEKFATPTARGLGARITVLGDADQAVHDPVDVRRAGMAYQHGHAVCDRAFHPKLVVFTGDDDAVLAVGSGNPTMSGWGHNHELWVTARGSRQTGPQLMIDVAEWLHDLPTVVPVASWIADTLRHVANQIRPSSVDERWSAFRAFGNLHQPLLERVPGGQVDELRLAAPFYDPKAEAVRALVQRTGPRAVRIAVQPSVAQFNGDALVRAAASTERQEFRLIGRGRARHGKLIEWDAGGVTVGMTGSANITVSALLMSTVQGGNCELVVVAPHATPLLPDGDPHPDTELRTLASVPPTPSASSGPAPVVLGCALVDCTLLVELAVALDHRVAIETSPSAAPGTWQEVGAVPHGQRTARFLVPEETGGAVRAFIDVDGERRESAVVFVTDPVRCRPRRDTADVPRLAHTYQPDELFTDPSIAQRFTTDFARLVELAAPAPGSPGRDRPRRADAPPADRWADYLEECDRRLGPALAGLIFPLRAAVEHTPAAGWSIDDIDESEVTEGEDESVLDDLDEDTAARQAPAVRPDERRRYRRFAAQWAASATGPRSREADRSTLPAVDLRMTVVALYLTLLAAGVWREEEHEDWRRDLRWLIWSLVPDDQMLDELPAEAFAHLYALLAVAMTTLRHNTALHGGRTADVLATEAWRDAAEWVAEVDIQLAEQRLFPATQPFAILADARGLWDTVLLARSTKQDPHVEARTTLADAGIAVRLDGNVWWVEGDGSAYRNAARAVTELSRASGHAVAVARNKRHTVLIALAGSTMVLADSQARVWRLYELSSTRTPLSLTVGIPAAPPGGRTTPLSAATPAEVHRLNQLAGVDLPAVVRRIWTPSP
ncbi:hypothetical protein [Dactylosporangium salmoneum]|uniref:PLD phosphodiesterase domain-containing protein n=1 Tax=Dactylosporangium salmoneum TaxID=53361 RepID=A0ABP5SUK6_9ACTN